jgi:hypothetical protein
MAGHEGSGNPAANGANHSSVSGPLFLVRVRVGTVGRQLSCILAVDECQHFAGADGIAEPLVEPGNHAFRMGGERCRAAGL